MADYYRKFQRQKSSVTALAKNTMEEKYKYPTKYIWIHVTHTYVHTKNTLSVYIYIYINYP